MIHWDFVMGGLAGAPLGAAAGLAIAYGVLAWTGTTEHQGRRGMLAAVYGIVPGLIAGFWVGSELAYWLVSRNVAWRSTVAGVATGAFLALLLFPAGLLVGVPLAERRGISNYAGERGAWALFYVALPLAVVGGIGGYLAGRAMAG